MSISNDKLYEVLLEIKGEIGGLKSGLESNQAHTLAVSVKASEIREHLDHHKESAMAHRGAIVGSMIFISGAIITIMRFARGEH